jgi:hypothetical protein
VESFEQKMKKIIEGVFRPSDEILKNVFYAEQYSLLSNDEWELVYILAIENFGVIDWMSFGSLEYPTGFIDDFVKYLQKHQPISFKDVAIDQNKLLPKWMSFFRAAESLLHIINLCKPSINFFFKHEWI